VGDRSLAVSIWGGIFLIFLELAILTAVAIVFSSFSTPALSALLTFFVFVIGHLSSSLRDLAAGIGSTAAAYFFGGIYYLLPNLAHFSFRSESANGMFPNGAMFIGGSLYAVFYVAILLTVTILIFSRRNFK
jgi:hypothetical protein